VLAVAADVDGEFEVAGLGDEVLGDGLGAVFGEGLVVARLADGIGEAGDVQAGLDPVAVVPERLFDLDPRLVELLLLRVADFPLVGLEDDVDVGDLDAEGPDLERHAGRIRVVGGDLDQGDRIGGTGQLTSMRDPARTLSSSISWL